MRRGRADSDEGWRQDVGCGTGRLLQVLQDRGITGRGVDRSDAALKICRDRGVDALPFDLESTEPLAWRSDLVTCTEVAEHLPESCADRLVDLLTSISDNILLTAAEPGRGGTDHVNEQPTSYWTRKFQDHGFEFGERTSLQIRDEWMRAGVAGCFHATLMIFRRSS